MITPKTVLLHVLALFSAVSSASAADAVVTVSADKPGAVICPEIYGQFAEHLGHGIYGGIWVGEDSKIPNVRGIRSDVVAALKNLKVPVVRWPGGCFADEYHWKDGVGPRCDRPSIINTNWGSVVEDNSFGTHEFMDFCEQIGAQPYICGNLGSGTVAEMSQWVEYMTSDAQSPMANLRRANGRDKPWKVKFFAVGNESWGCGGTMTPEYYCDNFRRYNSFLKNYGDNKLVRIACGPGGGDYNWTKVCMEKIGGAMDAVSLHQYTIPTGDWGRKGAATGFDESEWFSTLKNTIYMEELVSENCKIMDAADSQKRVGLYVDEWGTWYDPEPGTNGGFLIQQNSLRDAIVAALNFNIFHAHSDRVRMTNIAQMVNVLQCMIMTDGDKMCLTPTYHVFEMYKVHQGATYLPVAVKGPEYDFGDRSIPAISATASRAGDGAVHVDLVNADPNAAHEVECDLSGMNAKSVSGRILTADKMDAHNTFDNPDAVKPAAFAGAKIEGGRLIVKMPPKSIVALEVK